MRDGVKVEQINTTIKKPHVVQSGSYVWNKCLLMSELKTEVENVSIQAGIELPGAAV